MVCTGAASKPKRATMRVVVIGGVEYAVPTPTRSTPAASTSTAARTGTAKPTSPAFCAEHAAFRLAARLRPRPPPMVRLCIHASIQCTARTLTDGVTQTVQHGVTIRCARRDVFANSPLAAQAAVLHVLADSARHSDRAMARELLRRTHALRTCDAALHGAARQAAILAAPGLGFAWLAWHDSASQARVSVGYCPIAGNGLFAECVIEPGDKAHPLPELRGVVVETPRAATDWESIVRHLQAARGGAEATLLGPLALANAGCALCANLRLNGLGWRDDLGCPSTTLGAYATRRIALHEQLCVYYTPPLEDARCVLCTEPIY
jgi:hypothetical protein